MVIFFRSEQNFQRKTISKFDQSVSEVMTLRLAENFRFFLHDLISIFIFSCLGQKYFCYFHWIIYNEYSNEGTVLVKSMTDMSGN